MKMRHAIVLAVVLLLAGSSRLCAQVSLRVVELERYGLEDILVENDLVSFTVRPHSGGRIIRFVDKRTDKNLAQWEPMGPRKQDDGGLFRDLVPSEPHPGEQVYDRYSYKVLEKSPDRAVLELSWTGRSDITQGVKLTKRYALRKGVAAVEVTLTMANVGYGIVKKNWRIHHSVSVGGNYEAERVHAFSTSPAGVDDNRTNKWLKDFREGWLAWVNPETRRGLAVWVDYNELDRQLFWRTESMTTAEMVTRQVTLTPGQSWSIRAMVAPLEGLSAISTMTPGALYHMSLADGKPVVHVHALQGGTFAVQGQGDMALDKKIVKVEPGKIGRLQWDHAIAADKPVRLELSGPGDRRHRFVGFFGKPGREGADLARPEQVPGKVKQGELKRAEIRTTTDDQSADKLKVLVLATWQYIPVGVDDRADAVEMRRMSFRARNRFSHWLANHPAFDVTTVTERDYLEQLPRLYKYDVLVLDDFRALLIKPYVQDLLTWVEAGHGLVVMGGHGSFGGRGETFGDSRPIAPLLAVNLPDGQSYVDQTPRTEVVRKLRRGSHKRRDAFVMVERRHPHTGEPVRHELGGLIVRDGDDWIETGTPLEASGRDPAVAGLPLATLAPGYHKTTPRDGATVVARIGDHPAIVVKTHGKGRLVSVPVDDLRKLYFWPHTPQLVGQVIRCAAGRPWPVWVSSVEVDDRSVTVHVQASKDAEQPEVRVKAFRADGSVALESTRSVVLGKGGLGRCIIDGLEDLRRLPGRAVVEVEVTGGHRATVVVDVPHPEKPVVRIVPGPKRHWQPGHMVDPTIEVVDNRPGRVLESTLVDSRGYLVRGTLVELDGRTAPPTTLPVSTAGLSAGRYTYSVRVMENDEVVDCQHVTVGLARAKKPEFILYLFGFPGHGGTYASVAAHRLLGETTNLIFGPKLGRNTGYEYAVDRGLAEGLCYLPWANNGTSRGPRGQHRHDNRSATKHQWTREVLIPRLRRFRDFPSIYGFYLEDEGVDDLDGPVEREVYRTTFGEDPPETPTTPQQMRRLADYNVETLNTIFRVNAQAVRSINPQWQPVVLQMIVGNKGRHRGMSIDENFRDMIGPLADIYPRTTDQWPMMQMNVNRLRCAARRDNQPFWVTPHCIYAGLDVLRMQFWSIVGYGADGIGWYQQNSALYDGRWDDLAELNKLALRLGPLLARWEMPQADTAVYWSYYESSRPDMKPYHDSHVELARLMHEHDLPFDMVVEGELFDKAITRYRNLVVTGQTMKEPALVARLKELSKTMTVVVLDSPALKGKHGWAGKDDLSRVSPPVSTPKGVLVYRLHLDGTDYLVLFNNTVRPAVAALTTCVELSGASAYDLRRHTFIEKPAAGVPLGAMDGTILAMVDQSVRGVDVSVPKVVRRGQSVVVRLKLQTTRPLQGTTPVEIVVLDPEGTRHDISGTRLARNGALEVVLPLARNVPVGTWHVSATDLLSGNSTRRAVQCSAD